jgi:2-polyprenyl-3-methyl-5-hydroxy-6-metoxy-1,4-benzoquinol methylase
MVDYARSELSMSVTCTTFAHAEVPSGLDAISMWDYIEHTIDPRRELDKAAEHLRAGGILALSTGDIGTFSARVAGHSWHLLTPEHHNFFFESRTLHRLLQEPASTFSRRAIAPTCTQSRTCCTSSGRSDHWHL